MFSEAHGDRGNPELVPGRAEQVSHPPNTQGTGSAPGSLKCPRVANALRGWPKAAGEPVAHATRGRLRAMAVWALLWTGDGQPSPPLRVASGSASALERAFRKRPEVIRDECWSRASTRPGAATEDGAGAHADSCAGLSHGTSSVEPSPDASQAEARHPLHASPSHGWPGAPLRRPL